MSASPVNPCLAAALAYAGRDWPVLPLQSIVDAEMRRRNEPEDEAPEDDEAPESDTAGCIPQFDGIASADDEAPCPLIEDDDRE